MGPRFATRATDQPTAAPRSTPGYWVSDTATPGASSAPPAAAGGAMTSDGAMVSDQGADGAFCDPNSFYDGEGCGPDGCGPGGPLAAPYGFCPCPVTLWEEVHAHRRIWFDIDYLFFWSKGNQLPPLVTTSPPGTPQSQAGVLPESATTAILFPTGRVDTEGRSGARISLGYWLIDGEFTGIEGQYWALAQGSTTYDISSNGDPILARPFINVDPSLLTPREDAALIAFPGLVIGQSTGNLTGSIDIRTTANLQSANFDFRQLIWLDFTRQRRLDLLLGYRFFGVDDSVTINDQSLFTPTSGPIPITQFASQDVFSARNRFNGGEIGAKWQSYHGPFSIELVGKCAFGENSERMYINGFNTITSLGTTITYVGGLLAQPTNIGSYVRDVFAVLPEADGNLRWNITCNMRLVVGYTFVYINRVQRSGDAINRQLNPTQINGGTLVGPAQPSFSFHDTTFWAQGVNAGIEYRW